MGDEDIVRTWINDQLVEDPAQWISTDHLFANWKSWADEHGEFLLSSRRLVQRLEALGYEREKGGPKKDQRGFRGLETKEERGWRLAREVAEQKRKDEAKRDQQNLKEIIACWLEVFQAGKNVTAKRLSAAAEKHPRLKAALMSVTSNGSSAIASASLFNWLGKVESRPCNGYELELTRRGVWRVVKSGDDVTEDNHWPGEEDVAEDNHWPDEEDLRRY